MTGIGTSRREQKTGEAEATFGKRTELSDKLLESAQVPIEQGRRP